MSQPTFEPMGVGRIFDVAASLYRRNFLRFVAIIVLVKVPVTILAVLITMGFVSAGDPRLSALNGLLIGLLSLVAQQLSQGALIKGISGAYVGREVTVGEAYSAVLPRLLSLIVAAIAVALVVGVGFLLLIVPGVIFGLWFALTTQAIVVEDQRAFAGMSRSKELASGNLGKIFLVGLVAFLLGLAVGWVAEFIAGAVAGPGSAPQSVPVFGLILQGLIRMIGEIFVLPITAGAFVLLYYDLRIRKEGFDLEMMARSLQLETPEAEGEATADSPDDSPAAGTDEPLRPES